MRDCGYAVTLIAPGEAEPYRSAGIQFLPVRSRKGRVRRMSLTVFEVLRKAMQANADAYHIHSPELIPAGLVLRVLGKKTIFDSHEDLPDQVKDKPWIPPGLTMPIVLMSYGLIKLAGAAYSGVVAATPTIAQDFPAKKTTVVRNFPTIGTDHVIASRALSERPNHVVYVGGLSRTRGLIELVDAMVDVARQVPDARLLLLGRFTSADVESAARRSPGWKYVNFLGFCDRNKMNEILRGSRLGIVTIWPTANHVRSEPNKLFEYMLAGIPILSSNFDYWRQFVIDLQTGRMVDPKDSSAIAREIVWFLNHPEESAEMGQRGRSLALTTFSWSSEAEKLCEFYESFVFANKPS